MNQESVVLNLNPKNTLKVVKSQERADDHDAVMNGGGNGGGDDMLEARVAKLESDVSYIRRDVDELRTDVKSINQNMIVALERLDNIKENLSKKPSIDAVDKKITDAKLAVLLGVPGIIAIGTGIYKIIQHYF